MSKLTTKIKVRTKNNSDSYDENIYDLNGEGNFMKVVVDVNEVNNTLLSYTDDNGKTINFIPGDIVRTVDSSSETGYSFYRLHTITDGEAIWSKLNTGIIDDSAIININISSNLNDITDLINGSAYATLAVDGTNTTKYIDSNILQFKVDANKSWSITFNSGDAIWYKSPNTISDTSISNGRPTYNVVFLSEAVTGTIESGLTITLTGDNVHPTSDLSWLVAYDSTFTISASSKSGYNTSITVSPEDGNNGTYTAQNVNRTISVTYEEIKDGVFAIKTDGTEVSYADADNTCIGVVVRNSSENVSFWIPKNKSSYSVFSHMWSNTLYGTDVAGLTNFTDYTTSSPGYTTTLRTQALADYNSGKTGIVNTDTIIAAAPSESTSNNAAAWVRNLTNPITGLKDGYLMSITEAINIIDNISDINNTLNKIGGTLLTYLYSSSSDSYTFLWCSNEYGSRDAWGLYFSSSYAYPCIAYLIKYRSYNIYGVLAIFPL